MGGWGTNPSNIPPQPADEEEADVDTVSTYLLVTLGLGLLAMAMRLPPLVGFLAAGFVLAAAGVPYLEGIEVLADLGVTLLLFAVGLKLDPRLLLRREVWATAGAHMAFATALGAGFLGLLGVIGFGMLDGQGWGQLALLGFALSFSSTVVVVKMLDERSDSSALYGRIAVGILIIQDIAAVVFITASKGAWPSPWAIALVLLLPFTAAMKRIWDRIGHGELQALFGVVMALVPGYALFETVGLKGDLGALIMGVLLASHARSGELSRALFTLKELLLVAFFVSIGLQGHPSVATVGLGLLLLVMLPIQGIAWAFLLDLMRLRHRTSLLAAASLTNYSEFGLIVVAVGASSGMLNPDWLVVLSVAVAASFVVSSLLNRRIPTYIERIAERLPAQDPDRLNAHDRPIDVGGAEAVVLGMGRVGKAAYRQLESAYGLEVVGVEHNDQRIEGLRDRGYEVIEGDATDEDFWERVSHVGRVAVVVMAMPFHGSNMAALEQLKRNGFEGVVAAVAYYDDEMREIERAGVDAALHLYSGSGTALADRAALAAGLDLAAPVEDDDRVALLAPSDEAEPATP